MNLKKISLVNIRSYRQQEVEFPLGSTLLAGDVGAGKTTLLLAIEYALFGLQPGQKGSSLLANGEKEGSVVLEFDIDGLPIEISRVLRRSARGVSQEECWMQVGGERKELAVTELKSKILELLNYPEEFVKKTNLLYKYTVYSPQEEMKSIILEDSEIRLNLLRNIFGIDKYRRIKENLLLITFRLREQVRMLQFQVKGMVDYREKIQESEKKIENAVNQSVIFEKAFVYRQAQRQSAEAEVKALEALIAEAVALETELKKAEFEFKSKEGDLRESGAELKRFLEMLDNKSIAFIEEDYKKCLESLKDRKSNLEDAQKELIEISGTLKSLEMRREEVLEKRKRIFRIDICPTCLQNVSDNHKHNILTEAESQISQAAREKSEMQLIIGEKTARIKEINYSIAQIESAKSQFEMAKARLESSAYAKKRTEELEKKKQALQKDISSLGEHIRSLKETLFSYAKYKAKKSLKEDELKTARGEERASEIRMAESRKEIEFLNLELQRLLSELKGREELQKKLSSLSDFESWLSGPFTELISSIERRAFVWVREEFSRRFNLWFSMLTTDAFTVRLDETFTPVILQKEYELDYSFLSGGERTAVALAYRLALNQILNSIHTGLKTKGIIILDEPTDGFSEQQLEKIRDIFREIKVTQLIIVSHEPKMESFVDNVIRIRKDGGYSAKA